MLVDRDLRGIVDPVEHNCYDWAHTILAGAFPLVVGLLAEDLKDAFTQTDHT